MVHDSEDEACLTSQDLVQRAQGGDDSALHALVERHLPSLRAYVRARADTLILAQESCSDIVQSAFREALTGLHGYEWRGEGSFRYWLFSVAMNKLKGRRKFLTAQRRDVSRDQQASADQLHHSEIAAGFRNLLSPSQAAIANETFERLESALQRLPECDREFILMARVVGMSHAEIAQETGKQEGAVRTALHRALAKLSTEMLPRSAG